MIFFCPPYDPEKVILGEADYMGWITSNENEIEREFDSKCTRMAQIYWEKTFLSINLKIHMNFLRRHNGGRNGQIFRVENGLLLWLDCYPPANIIMDNIENLRNRINPVPAIQNHAENLHRESKASYTPKTPTSTGKHPRYTNIVQSLSNPHSALTINKSNSNSDTSSRSSSSEYETSRKTLKRNRFGYRSTTRDYRNIGGRTEFYGELSNMPINYQQNNILRNKSIDVEGLAFIMSRMSLSENRGSRLPRLACRLTKRTMIEEQQNNQRSSTDLNPSPVIKRNRKKL